MTQKVRAYTSWTDQANDEMSEWFWGHVVKFVVTGLAISVIPFSLGAAFAPEGTHRVEKGIEAAGMTHEFLWTSAGKAVVTVGTPVAQWLDNSSDS